MFNAGGQNHTPTDLFRHRSDCRRHMSFLSVRHHLKRSYQGRNIWGDPIIEKSQDQGQGQGQDHLLLQRAALPHFLVLALTMTLVLVLRFFNYRVVPDIPSLISSLDFSCCFLRQMVICWVGLPYWAT